MDKLINKRVETYDYISRYTGIPYYYDTAKKSDIYGLSRKINKNTAYVSHEVKQEDTLDYLSLKYYNNPTYWWAIAYFNSITDPFIKLSSKFRVIKIPAIASIVFED